MKIYTKGGDQGLTSLWGGKRVSKSVLRIEAYGTVDELNVNLGLVRDVIEEDKIKTILIEAQAMLFSFGAHLAVDPEKEGLKLPEIDPKKVEELESAIDQMEEVLPPLKSFILPGGHVNVSYCHLARVVCRRAERRVIALNNEAPVNPDIIVYLNRLSDYLFVLSRYIAKAHGAEEVPWTP